jgi:hypothetical protein
MNMGLGAVKKEKGVVVDNCATAIDSIKRNRILSFGCVEQLWKIK